MKKSVDEFTEPIVCDFILSFTKMIQDNPEAKLKFDELIKRELYCPDFPEKCAPYVQDKKPYQNGLKNEYQRIDQLGLKHFQPFDDSKLPTNDKEFYENHISSNLRRGKNCRILLNDNDGYSTDYYVPSKDSFIDKTEDLPLYKPMGGKMQKLEPGEFNNIRREYNQPSEIERTKLRELTSKRFKN